MTGIEILWLAHCLVLLAVVTWLLNRRRRPRPVDTGEYVCTCEETALNQQRAVLTSVIASQAAATAASTVVASSCIVHP